MLFIDNKSRIVITSRKLLLSIISFWAILTFTFCLTTVTGILYAADSAITSEDNARSFPRIRVVDSLTMKKVYPDEIMIGDKSTNKVVFKKVFTKQEALDKFQGDDFDPAVTVSAGIYQILINAAGYGNVSFIINIHKDEDQAKSPESFPTRIEFQLYPLSAPQDTHYTFMIPQKRKDSNIITGHLLDDKTGKPLSGAQISSDNGTIIAATFVSAFFFHRTPASKEDYEKDILFEKEGYISEERKNVFVWSKGSWIYEIRMKYGKGKNTVDSRKNRRW